KRIVFERDFGIWSYDLASAQAREIAITLRGAPAAPMSTHGTVTGGFQELALSPDGRKVAFAVHGELFAASARDGGDAMRVTSTAAAEGQLAWAPDSRRLAYASDRDGEYELFLYDFAAR